MSKVNGDHMSKQFIAILIIVVGGLFAILAVTNNKKTDSGNQSGSSSQPTSHIEGKLDSKVKLTEYGDFQCPACASYYPIIKQLKEEYKDRVAFQFRHFPLTSIHQNAFVGSRAAEAAGKQGKFIQMHDLLYENQKIWSVETDPTSTLVGYAQQLSLNVEQFKSDMTSSIVSDLINADRKAAQEFNATGTPTFVLNNKKLDKSPGSYEEFKKLLDDELSKLN